MEKHRLEKIRTLVVTQLGGPLPIIGTKATALLLVAFAIIYVGDCIRYHVDSIQTRMLENDDGR